MHTAARQWVEAHLPAKAGDVLEIGSRNINGGVRDLFADAKSFLGVDLVDGTDVDVVGDFATLDMVGVADTVLCLEVLEHVELWRDLLGACIDACRPGGTIIITAAGPTREPHSAIDGGRLRPDEYYENLTTKALKKELASLDPLLINELGGDVRAVGVRP